MEKGLAQGFRDVDSSSDPSRLASYLDEVAGLLSPHKQATLSLLDLTPGSAVLDVACGAGDDVRRLAEVVAPGGRAVGLDRSDSLLAEARARSSGDSSVEFVAADAHAMPFAANEFDAALVSRSLQHMGDPVTVLSEMARVVRPGGRVMAIEPDWHTLAISGEDLDTAGVVGREIAAQTLNPAAGRSLPAWYASAGLVLNRLDAVTIPFRSYQIAEQLLFIGEAVERLATPAVRAWRDDLRRQDTDGTFFASLTGFIATGAPVAT